MPRSAATEPVLRLRACVNLECSAIFTICVSYDRGQRYCSEQCRAANRRRQRSAANSRYQQSEGGRECHRRSQQRYRDQKSENVMVTDRGSESITTPVARAGSSLHMPHLRHGEPLDQPLPCRAEELEAGRKSKIRRF